MSNNQQISSWQSILAGAAAGGTESLLTYPTEYLKTRQQLPIPGPGTGAGTAARAKTPLLTLLTQTIRHQGLRALYTGSSVFCASNASKSAIRFFTFDSARKTLPLPRDSQTGTVTPLGTMLAGLVAGISEAVVVVTPGETVKTKMIDDRAGPRLYRSTGHAIVSIVAREGLGGLYRGVVPVMMKQGANAMVRFTSYNVLLQWLEGTGIMGKSMNTVLAGAMAGVVTVYATMPFDTLKTRLQAGDARTRYTGSVDCLRSVVTGEGVRALWRGTTPRLVRLSVSGALSFSIYESVLAWTWKYAAREGREIA